MRKHALCPAARIAAGGRCAVRHRWQTVGAPRAQKASAATGKGNPTTRSVSVAQSLATSCRPSAVRTSTRWVDASPASSASAPPNGVVTTNSSRGAACVHANDTEMPSSPRRADSLPSMANGASAAGGNAGSGAKGVLAHPATTNASTATSA
jgi:hypothetical protein